MKKNINFYNLHEQDMDFSFKVIKQIIFSDKKDIKKNSFQKRIITNSVIISLVIFGIFFTFNSYELSKTSNLSATISNINNDVSNNNEKMNAWSNSLEYINPSKNKYEILINKANPITEENVKDYTIVDVENNTFKNVKLEEQTYKNYLNLKQNLAERNYFINIRSGFRSFEESNRTYDYFVKVKGLQYARKYVAQAGESEHNTGISFDFVISTNPNSIKNDYNSDEYFYLENIAYLYGFIIRYPKNKENITGYEYEPWHLRYVGTELAKYLKKNNLTLEEYYKTRD